MIEEMRQTKSDQTQPWINVCMRMVMCGTAVSTLGGFAFGMAFLFGLPAASSMTLEIVLSGIFTGFVFGGGFGLIYGILASPIIGLAMTVTAALFFRCGRRPRLLKLTFGTLTAVPIYLVSPFHIVRNAFAQILEGSSYNLLADWSVMAIYVLAIYLSQIVARKYLREISPRKRKDKPA
ncbi:MAG: hypothetical protein OXG78_10275 [Chloroflexi bacterium]|nr:hypothetical protein [Chloroflexota bacterium]